MSEDNPRDVDVFNLFGRDFASESSERVNGTVLSSDLDIRLLFSEHDSDEMQINGSYNNLNFILVKLERVDNVGDHLLSLRKSVIALPVASDKDFAH
jgi:hypothetical protein